MKNRENNTTPRLSRPTKQGVPTITPKMIARGAESIALAKSEAITDFEEAMHTDEIAELLAELKGVDKTRERNLFVMRSLLRKLAHEQEATRAQNQEQNTLGWEATAEDWATALEAADESGAFECIQETILPDEVIMIDPPPTEEFIHSHSEQAESTPVRSSRTTREDLKTAVASHETKHGEVKLRSLEKHYCQRLVERLKELSDNEKAIILRGLDDDTKAKIAKILAEKDDVGVPKNERNRLLRKQILDTRKDDVIVLGNQQAAVAIFTQKKD
jgi:hypothetical protein